VEETALAVDALCGWLGGPGRQGPDDLVGQARQAVRSGVDWLLDATTQGREFPAAPIGLYFAQLWYFERLYPLAWTVSAWAAAGQFLPSSDA
jgi:squalene-hopene/tetraprenyl-beta-curcumene cyclase